MLAKPRIGLIEYLTRDLRKRRKRKRKKGKPGQSLFYVNCNGRGKTKKKSRVGTIAAIPWLR